MFNIIVSADSRYPVNKLAIHATVVEVLERYKVSGRVEIGVNIIGDRKMHEINKKFRGIDSTTNVLSFALEDPTSIKLIKGLGFIAAPDKILRLGDIVVSYPQAKEDAADEGITIDEEIMALVEHSVKHLLGMHDH